MAAARLSRLTALLGAALLLPLSATFADELDGFISTLNDAQRVSSGANTLTADEIATLDGFVADDLGRARQLRVNSLDGSFSRRLSADQRERSGLERLAAQQVTELDQLVAYAIASQPVPRERPRLRDDQVVSLKSRLEVHGGMSFTLGWASGGRNFREASAWVSYYDPKTGLGIGIALSQYKGDFFPGYYGYGYPYDGYYGYDYPYRSGFGGYTGMWRPSLGHDATYRRSNGFISARPDMMRRDGDFDRAF